MSWHVKRVNANGRVVCSRPFTARCSALQEADFWTRNGWTTEVTETNERRSTYANA